MVAATSSGLRPALLLLFVSCLNLAYIWWCTRRTPVVNPPPAYSYRGHDFPEFLPLPSPLASVLMTVEDTAHYPVLGMASDPEWLSLTSAGAGYVRLGPEDRMFAVTMFHELHCLRMLNFAFSKTWIATHEHVRHCLNYLRQGALCSPNLTLEPGNFEVRDFDNDGAGTTHVCRDWSAVYAVADSNYVAWNHTASR